jgi:hypothetical protein
MAFPVSPTEGQTFTENNTVWIYSAVMGQWNRSVINPLNETLYEFGSASATGNAGEIQYTDGTNLAASPNLLWDNANNELEVGGDVVLDDGGTYTTTLQTITPTAARTISFPDATGTVALVAGSSGQAAAEILEYSIWDLTWRPECPDPRGMTCVDGRFWCDLYLCGSTSYAGTDFSAVPSSKIGLTIADNSSPPLIPGFYGGNGSTAYTLTSGNNPGSWYNFTEVAHSFGKRLMFSWEFQAAAFGAPEAGSRGSDPGTVIWERESKWGLAQATGTLWTWAIERVGIYTSGTNTNTGGRGTEYADSPRALLLGGDWNAGAVSGSRSANWVFVPSFGANIVGARFAAGHQVTG